MSPQSRRGVMRLLVALLVPWFLYWGWKLFEVLQRLWLAEPYRYIPAFGYDSLQAERDQILVIAFGVPVAILVVILTVRWVRDGFKSSDDTAGL